MIGTDREDAANGGTARQHELVAKSDCAIWSDYLGHRYGRRWAVRNLDLRVPRGSIYGFLGLNGAGKSTTMRMMLGLIPIHEGSMMVAGSNPVDADIEIKRRVGYVPDTPVFYDWMTVEETCALVAHYRKDRWDAKRQAALIKDFDLDARAKTDSLSKGQRARLALVLALAFNPELLVLDEPTLGLDPVARKQFAEGVLKQFAGEGRTVFISSHLIHEIAGIVDQVGIIMNGNLIVQEPASSLHDRYRRVEFTYDDAAPGSPPPAFTGLQYHAAGREAVLIHNDAAELTPEDLSQFGAVQTDVREMALEEIFIEATKSTSSKEEVR